MTTPAESVPVYRRFLIPTRLGEGAGFTVAADYEAILLSVMELLAGRYESDPAYPFIDTKIDLLTGEDFPRQDRMRGKDAVYGWIQGRGLEAIAGHCLWMRRGPEAPAGAYPQGGATHTAKTARQQQRPITFCHDPGRRAVYHRLRRALPAT
jgi:hypothetical protein